MTLLYRLRCALLPIFALLGVGSAMADTLQVEPAADTTLFEVGVGNAETANSRGAHLFAGRIASNERRRALLRFDLSAIPPGSTINSAQLSLSLTREPPGPLPAVNFSLFPVNASWVEGSSDAGDPGGNGTFPTTGDPTWTQRAFPATPWATPGGDFSGTLSALTSANTLGRYQWGSTAAMVAVVQGWVDAPTFNFGWVLMADEAAGTLTARRFASREAASANTRPLLLIDYTPGGGPQPQFPSAIPTLSIAGVLVLLVLLAWAARGALRRSSHSPH